MSSPARGLCEWAQNGVLLSCLGLMKRDAARVGPPLERSFSLLLFECWIPATFCRIPEWADGAPRCSLLAVVCKIFEQEMHTLGHEDVGQRGESTRLPLMTSARNDASIQSHPALDAAMTLAAAAGRRHPRYIVQFPCHVCGKHSYWRSDIQSRRIGTIIHGYLYWPFVNGMW